jgi:hypothetical protein
MGFVMLFPYTHIMFFDFFKLQITLLRKLLNLLFSVFASVNGAAGK